MAVVRPNLMLRVLVVYSQPFEIILVNALQFSVPWELRLARMLLLLAVTDKIYLLVFRPSSVCFGLS